MWRIERPAPAPLLVAGLALCAWAALLVWGASPYGRYLRHDQAASAATLALFLAGWLLMSAAMMLPTATRLLRDFGAVVRRRPERGRLQALVVAGFLATWLAAGYAFRALDLGVHALVSALAWLQARPQLIGGGVLVAAGLFQFSPLKHRCLTACRSPRSFVYRHWSGRRPRADAFRVGVAYGASCVGCCWALMLVMFALGTVNLALMLALAALMAIEKTAPGGAALSRPAGIALIAAGVASVLA
jgi:predicted metal-binding membrane protein